MTSSALLSEVFTLKKRSSEPSSARHESQSRRHEGRSQAQRKSQKAEESARSREAILDATEQILLDEGYAAVSSRYVASKAGMKSQLLHYYYRTMDDLFIAVFQRLQERFYQRFPNVVAADHPIRELWNLNMEAASTKLYHEFKAAAAHRKAIRALIASSTRHDRSMQVAACRLVMARLGMSPDVLPPTVLAMLMASLARTLVTEQSLGVSDGHAETLTFVERYLQRMESQLDASDTAQQSRESKGATAKNATTKPLRGQRVKRVR